MDLFIILLMCYGTLIRISLTESQVSIPDELKICYVNNNIQDFHLPMNIRVLLDIIRKTERYYYSMMDIRTMSSSLMHRFKLDGIEHYENIRAKSGILPYGQSGKQSVKYKLVKQMVPGQPELFPSDALTAIERCTLHQAISNTIMKQSSRDTDILCQEIGQKLTGRAIFADLWNCPREYGVILTPYGTIAPGAIIGAIAAALQHQNVGLKEIISMMTSERPSTTESVNHIEEVDFIVPRDEMIRDRSMSYHPSLIQIDNVWLATIAGELAEMVVYQGPTLGPNMELGATGFWNNTMRPNDFYLKNKNGYFDATRAEIVGDIDGFIVASKMQTWVDDFYSLRLSQILDMYYSDEGLTLFNENLKVCDRRKAFSHVVPKTLLDEQTYVASQLLAYYNSITFKSPEALRELVDYAVTKFSDYANNHLLTELLCRDKKPYPQVEALIAFDGAWTREHTMDFIAALIDDLDVSMYGSKMGILHGTSGQWLLNATNSPSLAYYAVSNFTKISWPTRLDLAVTLKAISNYLNETWEAKWQRHIIGGFGQAIVILAPLAQFSETEQQIILTLLREIKRAHPDLYFVYYTSQRNSHLFQPFILSQQDRLIFNSDIDAVVEYLSTVPRTLRPVITSGLANNSSEFKDEMEDYISPSKSTTYLFHSEYAVNTEKLTITIHNFGYGMIKACSWNQFDGKERTVCQQLEAHEEKSLIDDFKCIDARCPYIYLRVENATSLNKCAEIECRSPNQVRYIIRMEHTYKNSANQIFINTFIVLYLYLQLTVINM
ncbi:uncharacterized protein LOC105286222 isoform X2 [Ooceraea biroi]|uniref:uncharacterized protein LOC105286222 isoform X2 n=1 Tax=Ooceraea biroi TaxID=2015173 RepID=UPI0005BB012E|nr:uncharacterized protein LOC105286222 isoform X2 [Ooceraea biroi]